MPWWLNYVGLEWEAYATGPDKYDCWGLVNHCLKTHYGIEVKRYIDIHTDDKKAFHRAVEEQLNMGHWIALDKPKEGCLVLMSKDRLIHHIGIYVDGGVLHARDGVEVCKESIDKLKTLGFKRFEFCIHDSIN